MAVAKNRKTGGAMSWSSTSQMGIARLLLLRSRMRKRLSRDLEVYTLRRWEGGLEILR